MGCAVGERRGGLIRSWRSIGGVTILIVLGLVGGGEAQAARVRPSARTASSPGYWLVGADGGVFSFNAPFYGSALPSDGSPSDCSYVPGASGPSISDDGCTAIAATPSGSGYLVTDANQLPTAFGFPAPQSAGCTSLNGAAGFWSGVASTPTGDGFFLTSTNGGVLGCGGATPLGGVTALHLAQPIVGIATTPDGEEYWLVAADGGVFAFGDAQFSGSMAGHHLAA